MTVHAHTNESDSLVSAISLASGDRFGSEKLRGVVAALLQSAEYLVDIAGNFAGEFEERRKRLGRVVDACLGSEDSSMRDYGRGIAKTGDVDSGDVPAIARTAIHGYSDITEVLLRAGADANTERTVTDIPVLFYAVEHGHMDDTCLLLQYGANPNAFNRWNDSTALIAACNLLNTSGYEFRAIVVMFHLLMRPDLDLRTHNQWERTWQYFQNWRRSDEPKAFRDPVMVDWIQELLESKMKKQGIDIPL